MGIINETVANTRLVEKFIGSAYDTVKAVANELGSVETVAAAVISGGLAKIAAAADAGDLAAVAAIAEDIQKVVNLVAGFNNSYYGPSPTNPETRPGGSLMQEGDMYLNTVTKLMNTYSGSSWSPVGVSTKFKTEVVTITQDMLVLGNTIVPLLNPYVPGTSTLVVYVGAAFQYSTSTHGSGAYDETSSNSITFTGVNLIVGEKVIVTVGATVSNITTNIASYKKVYLTGSVNEAVITLPEGMTYVPASGDLDVFKEGVLMAPSYDYTESSPTTITFNTPIYDIGTRIVFKKLENI